MGASTLREDAASPTCSSTMLDCLSSNKRSSHVAHRFSRHIGVEREMRVTYNQPHLVAPMKLTVYDQIPATPVPASASNFSQWMAQSRDVVSRASTRTSMSGRKKLVKRSLISKPQFIQPADDLPLRTTSSFRPLQLSIYERAKRLSDLPAFDRLSFTEYGEIRVPPRALMRTQSEDLLRARSHEVAVDMPQKPVSMYERPQSRRIPHSRGNTLSSIQSSSRPVSEYDALHSHPVSMYDLPELPPQVYMAAPSQIRKALTPMEEEFSLHPSASVEIDGTTLIFPEIQARRTLSERSHSYLLPPAPEQEDEGAAPSPVIDPGPNRKTFVTIHKSQPSQAASIKRLSKITDYASSDVLAMMPESTHRKQSFGEKEPSDRVSQWLEGEEAGTANGSRNSSISTIKTNVSSSTTASFAEHRAKRFQFYQLNTNTERRPHSADGSPISAASRMPTPLKLYQPFPSGIAITHVPIRDSSKSFKNQRSHERTYTDSTVASTVEPEMLFDEEKDTHHYAIADDAYSMTTYSSPTSRTGTVKSCAGKTATTGAPAYVDIETIIVPQKIGRPVSFDFVNYQKPTILSPRSQAADVEKLMHELCGQAGYRRVNVGVAF